jgi:hypothetical protein
MMSHALTKCAAELALLLLAGLMLSWTTAAWAADLEWTAASDGLWSNAANWSPATAPASPADNATIAALGDPYTVTVNQPTSVGAVVIDSPAARLRIDRTEFSAAGGIRIDQGTFNLGGNGAALSNTRIEGAAGPGAVFLSGRLNNIELAIDSFAQSAAIEGVLHLDDAEFGSAYGSLAPGSAVTGQGTWRLGLSSGTTTSQYFSIEVPVKSGGNFTLGEGVTLAASPYLTILGSENSSEFINEGAVTALTPGSQLRFERLRNRGTLATGSGGRITATLVGDVGEIDIAAGGYLQLQGALKFNHSVTVGDGGELSISSVSSRPTGLPVMLQSGGKVYLPRLAYAASVSSSGGVVVLNAPYTIAELNSLSITGPATLEIGANASLDLGGAVLDYTTLSRPVALSGTIRNGTYTGPSVVRDINNATFSNLTMDVPTRVLGTVTYQDTSVLQHPVEVDGGRLVLADDWDNQSTITVTSGTLAIKDASASPANAGSIVFHGGDLLVGYDITMSELLSLPFVLPETTIIGTYGPTLNLEGGVWDTATTPTRLVFDNGRAYNGTIRGPADQSSVVEFGFNARADNVTLESLTLLKSAAGGSFYNANLRSVTVESADNASTVMNGGVLEDVTINGRLSFDQTVAVNGHLQVNGLLAGNYRTALLRLSPGATIGGSGVIGNTVGRIQGTRIEIVDESFTFPAGMTLISATEYDSTSVIAAPATNLHIASAIIVGHEDPWSGRSDSWTFQAASLETTGPIQVNFDGGLAVEGGPWTHAGVMTLDDGLINAESLHVAAGGLVIGNGSINTTIGSVIDGTLRPGEGLDPDASAGILAFTSLGLTDAATIAIDIGGVDRGARHDAIDVTHAMTLGGALSVSLLGDYVPVGGESFDLFNFAAISGNFDSIQLPDLPNGLSWDTSQLAVGGELSVVGSLLAGDYNSDGAVNAADYTVWRDNLGAPAGTLENDVDGGVIGMAHYETWRSNYGAESAPMAFETAIPEPSAGVILVLASPILLRRRRAVGYRRQAMCLGY